MTKADFLRELESQLDLAPGSMEENQALSQMKGWDSMAAVLFMAVADEKAGVLISGNDVAGAKTVGDLLALVGDRLSAWGRTKPY